MNELCEYCLQVFTSVYKCLQWWQVGEVLAGGGGWECGERVVGWD